VFGFFVLMVIFCGMFVVSCCFVGVCGCFLVLFVCGGLFKGLRGVFFWGVIVFFVWAFFFLKFFFFWTVVFFV